VRGGRPVTRWLFGSACAAHSTVNLPDPPLRTIIGPGARHMVAMALDQRHMDYSRDLEFQWPA
jgi:hypothetical protein